jgi:hypothetical protein
MAEEQERIDSYEHQIRKKSRVEKERTKTKCSQHHHIAEPR